MPSLFDEYRTLLELLKAVTDRHLGTYGTETPLTLSHLSVILAAAIEQIDEVQAMAS